MRAKWANAWAQLWWTNNRYVWMWLQMHREIDLKKCHRFYSPKCLCWCHFPSRSSARRSWDLHRCVLLVVELDEWDASVEMMDTAIDLENRPTWSQTAGEKLTQNPWMHSRKMRGKIEKFKLKSRIYQLKTSGQMAICKCHALNFGLFDNDFFDSFVVTFLFTHKLYTV